MRKYDPFVDLPQDVLAEIGERLRVLDHTMMSIVAQRMDLARQVVFAKHRQADDDHPDGSPIYNKEREIARLSGIREIAVEYGVDPEFGATLLYALINESCKEQMKMLQARDFSYGDMDPVSLARNLMELTRAVAPEYDDGFGDNYPATKMYLAFESQVVQSQIVELAETGVALDLGCATGRTAFELATSFDTVYGLDISFEMTERASALAHARGVKNAMFVNADMEHESAWRNFPAGTFDLVVMGLGTAGDIRATKEVIRRIEKVLKPGGRFVLSFYNANGLVYRFPFLPWSSSLAGVMDPYRKCLEVRVHDRDYAIFAQAHTEDEVGELIGGRLHLEQTYTHPTTASIMPREMMFLSPEIFEQIEAMDRDRAMNPPSGDGDGAYIIATGFKS